MVNKFKLPYQFRFRNFSYATLDVGGRGEDAYCVGDASSLVKAEELAVELSNSVYWELVPLILILIRNLEL